LNILEVLQYTSQLTKLKEFYSGILGLEIFTDLEYTFTVKAGSSKLTFIEDEFEANPYYHFAFNIPENKIYKAIKWLESKVELIVYGDSSLVSFPNWNAHSVYFFDPAGNIVELIARHNLPNRTDREFSSASLLSISEVGMPVTSVKSCCNTLNQMLDENLWWGNLETFAAIGDENGLFIVVTSNRNWFPTAKPCGIFPLTVKIENHRTISSSIEFSPYKIIAL
jgi:catechol-2,3-dioxygenase